MDEILKWRPLLEMLADELGCSWTVLAGQLLQESGGDPGAIGDNSRAYGLAQIHTATKNNHAFSRNWEIERLLDPVANLAVYIAEMRRLYGWLVSKWGHSVDHPDWLLVCWNWGAGNVRRHINEGKGLTDLPPQVRLHLDLYRQKSKLFENRP